MKIKSNAKLWTQKQQLFEHPKISENMVYIYMWFGLQNNFVTNTYKMVDMLAFSNLLMSYYHRNLFLPAFLSFSDYNSREAIEVAELQDIFCLV